MTTQKKCKECGTPVEHTAAKESFEKYGAIYCKEHRDAIDADEPLPSEEDSSAPSAPQEEPDQQTFNSGDGSGDDVPVLKYDERAPMPEVVEDFKRAQMATNAISVREPAPIPQVIPALDMDTIKEYICPDATDQEAFMFLRLCQSRGLNPFTNQAYLIKYNKNSKAVMVVGKDTFTERAEQNPNFDGFEAGIIVNCGEKGMHDIIEEREGTFMYEGEELLGGWCKVHRKDHTYPITAKVSMKEYTQIVKATGKPNAQWTKMPATMIRKVAIVQSLRESFPSDLGGCYDSSEMGAEI